MKEYPGDVRALDQMSFAVEEGTVFGLGLERRRCAPTAVHAHHVGAARMRGARRVAGHDVSAEPALVRSTIGVVAQRGGADREATAREND